MRILLLLPIGSIAASIFIPFLTSSWFVNGAFHTAFCGRGSSSACSSSCSHRTNTRGTLLFLSSKEGDTSSSGGGGEGFTKQTGPDGDYYAFDYDAVAATKLEEEENNNNNSALLQTELDQRNKARKKFGLKPLTLAQFVALKAQSAEIGKQQLQDATDSAFAKFDANGDGVITLQEFKSGLEGMLRARRKGEATALSESALTKIFEYYDTSGDGLLQPDEFVTLDRLRSKLDLVLQEEEEDEGSSSSSGNNNPFQNFMNKLTSHLEDTCASNDDCYSPEVCCDFGYTKRCCTRSGGGGGGGRKEAQLQYATIPVQQQV